MTAEATGHHRHSPDRVPPRYSPPAKAPYFPAPGWPKGHVQSLCCPVPGDSHHTEAGVGRCPAAQGPSGRPGWAPHEERWPQADTPISAPLLDLLGFRKKDASVRPCARGAAKPELWPLFRASSLDSPVHLLRIPHLSPACLNMAPCLATHPVERSGESGRSGALCPTTPDGE